LHNDLPDLIDIASYLTADFGDNLAGAVARYRFLMELDANFGSDWIMLPGGTASFQAYTESRTSFVFGNFLATIVLAQGLVENLLGSHLYIQEGIKPIHGLPQRQSGDLSARPSVREILSKSVEDGLISADLKARIDRLIGLRNPLVHYRNVDDGAHLMRRSMKENIPESELLETDADFAVSVIVELAHTSMQAAIP
jgi:hypothetical protein